MDRIKKKSKATSDLEATLRILPYYSFVYDNMFRIIYPGKWTQHVVHECILHTKGQQLLFLHKAVFKKHPQTLDVYKPKAFDTRIKSLLFSSTKNINILYHDEPLFLQFILQTKRVNATLAISFGTQRMDCIQNKSSI